MFKKPLRVIALVLILGLSLGQAAWAAGPAIAALPSGILTIPILSAQPIHRQKSAFLSLESLLDQKGIHYAREDIAQKSIVIDILTGVISPLDDGDLVISVFALNKVAQSYGLTLSGANLSWDDLVKIYQTNPNARIIAHISNAHYVIVTGITATSITYIDPGIGKDKSNQTLTIEKSEFLKNWTGNVTAETTLIQPVVTSSLIAGGKSHLLSAAEAQSIRGAGLPPWLTQALNIGGMIMNFIVPGSGVPLMLISAAISLASGDWMGAITSSVGAAFAGLGDSLGAIFKGAFAGLTKAFGPAGQILQNIGATFSKVYLGVTGFLDKAVNFLPGIGSALQGAVVQFGGSTIGSQVVNYALQTGISLGTSHGLQALGLSATASSFLGSLASATLSGAIKGDTIARNGQIITQSQNIQSSVMQTITLNQVGSLGMGLTIDPTLTSLIGYSLGAMQGQIIENPTTTLGQAFAFIKPDLSSSLAGYGAQKIGTSLGLSPVFSNALGSVVFKLAQPQVIPGTITDGTSGSYTLDTETYWDEASGQEMRIPGPSQDPAASAQWNQVLSVIRAGLPLAAAYAAQAYLTKASVVNQLTGVTPSAPAPTQVPIPQGATALTYTDPLGNSQDAYKITSGANYEIHNRSTQTLLARYRGGVLEEGDFRQQVVKKSDGTRTTRSTDLLKGRITYSKYITDQAVMTVNEGNIQNIRIDAVNHEIQPSQDIVLDPNRNVVSGSVEILSLGIRLYVSNGKVTKDKAGTTPYTSKDLLRSFARAYIFANGFNNKSVPEGTFDTLIPPYVKDLEKDGVLTTTLQEFIIPLYEVTDLFGNMADWSSDFLLHLDERDTLRNVLKGEVILSQMPGALKGMILYGIDNYLVDEAYQKLIAQEEAKGFSITDGIVFTHSGGFMPLMGALERAKPSGAKFDVNTVISYEGVYVDDSMQIDNPSLKRVINVWGTVDFTDTLAKGLIDHKLLDFGPTIPQKMSSFQGSLPTSIESINIRITGAYHNDFTYDPDNYSGILTPEEQERDLINRKTNEFMRDLYKKSAADQTTPGSLEAFLLGATGVVYDRVTKVATVSAKDYVALP